MNFNEFQETRKADSIDHPLAISLTENDDFKESYISCFLYEFEEETVLIFKRALYTYNEKTYCDYVVPLPGDNASFATLHEAENCLWCEYCNCGE